VAAPLRRQRRGAVIVGAGARPSSDGGPSAQAPLLALTQWALSAGIKYAPGLRPTEVPGGARLLPEGVRASALMSPTSPRSPALTAASPSRYQHARLHCASIPRTPGGRGVITTFPVAAGAALVSVPPRLALSSAGAPPTALPPAGAAAWASPDCPWYARLAVRLLLERAAGAASPLAPFVAALPRDAAAVGLPAAWAPPEVTQLQVPSLIRQVRAGPARSRRPAWTPGMG
jgi:hypothetical protein